MSDAYQLTKSVAVSLLRGQLAAGVALTRELISSHVDTALSLSPDWRLGVDRDALIKDLESQYSVWIGRAQTLDDPTGHEAWLPQKRGSISWQYWERYKLHLAGQWPPASVDGLDELTDTILERLEDPTREGPWDRRGLVVGHVQSGKTANYVGLINKAVDAGYRVIVVLSGIHKSLRSQTQMRLDEGFLGYESAAAVAANQALKRIGVGQIAPGLRPDSITNRSDDGDFKRAVAERFQINPGSNPLLFVIKKNASVLKNLLEWVMWAASSTDEKSGRPIVRGIPLLVIDDEADNASVDTKAQQLDEDGQVNPDHDPTVINRRIRQLLHSFDRAAYVGYTATPFANIFIHETASTAKEGDDLFPRSFIANLPAPSDYVGPLRVFGMDALPEADLKEAEGLPIIRIISDHAPPTPPDGGPIMGGGWMPSKHDKTHVPEHSDKAGIPPSLQQAIQSFIIACAGRRARGQVAVHNSMLIHVTRFTAVQEKVFEQVRAYVINLSDRLKFGEGQAPHPVVGQMKRLWESDFAPTTLRIDGQNDISWSDVEKELWTAISAVVVRRINGSAPDILDYETHKKAGLTVIAIGGDKLARGLTLEGLTVSYFLRASRMYDTLLQMGRWFGYRPNYLDLCRMYMTEDLQEWFEHITAASEELRLEFDRMAAIGETPKNYGLRVQSHSVLMITSSVKMRNGVELELAFEGGISETTVFSLDTAIRDSNFRTLEALVRRIGGSRSATVNPKQSRPGGRTDEWPASFLWADVPAEVIVTFLSQIKTYETAKRVNGALMASYIRKAAADGFMSSWTIAMIGTSDSTSTDICGLNLRLVTRNPSDGVPTTAGKYSFKRLLSPRDEAIDLDAAQYSQALERTQAAWKPDAARSPDKTGPKIPNGPNLRHARSSSKGLLLLYPFLPTVAATPELTPKPIIGFAVSFPGAAPAKKVTYRVNNTYWAQEFGDPR